MRLDHAFRPSALGNQWPDIDRISVAAGLATPYTTNLRLFLSSRTTPDYVTCEDQRDEDACTNLVLICVRGVDSEYHAQAFQRH